MIRMSKNKERREKELKLNQNIFDLNLNYIIKFDQKLEIIKYIEVTLINYIK